MRIRSREEILANILEIALSPIKKTAIMFSANLSYAQLVRYLQLLENKDLIQIQNGHWVATEKGREFVNAYSAMSKIITQDEEVQALSRIQ